MGGRAVMLALRCILETRAQEMTGVYYLGVTMIVREEKDVLLVQ